MSAGRAALVALALLMIAGCGGGDGADADAAKDGGAAFTEVSRQPTLTRTARRAAPRWERVVVLRGSAPLTRRISISAGAIQWRARWRCTSGRLALKLEPEPRTAAERSGGRCPGRGEATWVQTGDQRLSIAADDRFSVVVEQQVDTAIDEPPLPAMRASGARVLASGSFFDVERSGRGRVRLYRLPGGRAALRLDPFRTSSNTDLFVWLSAAARPRTTRQGVTARRIGRLIALKSTIGPQNYLLPRGIDTRRIRSVLIWCEPIQIVYTAAALSR